MQLQRQIGAVSAVLITIGAIIGSGIFAIPHDVATQVGSIGTTLLLWVVGGILAMLGALTFAELGAALPETGGMYVFLRRTFGPMAGFIYAWARFTVLIPSSVGFFAQVSARHVVDFAGAPSAWETPTAIAVVALVVAANLRGVLTGAGLQNLATVIKFGGLGALALGGIWVSVGHAPSLAAATAAPVGMITLITALVPILWAYDGWIDLTAIAGEVRRPERTIPLALGVGTLLVMGIYLLANVAYLQVLGPIALAATRTPAVAVGEHLLGTAGGTLASVLVTVSTFGGCTVALLTGSRIVYAMAADGLFLRPFAALSSTGVPHMAILACAGMAILYLTSPIGRLGDLFVIGVWPFYALGAIGAIRLRRREPDLARPYRTLGYPVTNGLFALASVAIVVGYSIANPWHTAISFGLIGVGAVVGRVIGVGTTPATAAAD